MAWQDIGEQAYARIRDMPKVEEEVNVRGSRFLYLYFDGKPTRLLACRYQLVGSDTWIIRADASLSGGSAKNG